MKDYKQIKQMLSESDSVELSTGVGYDPYRMNAVDDVGHDYFYLSKSDEFRRLNAYVAQLIGHPVLDADDAFKNMALRLGAIGIDIAPFSFRDEGQGVNSVELEVAQYPGYEEGPDHGPVPAATSDKIPGGLFLVLSWEIVDGKFVFTEAYFASGAELDAAEVDEFEGMEDDLEDMEGLEESQKEYKIQQRTEKLRKAVKDAYEKMQAATGDAKAKAKADWVAANEKMDAFMAKLDESVLVEGYESKVLELLKDNDIEAWFSNSKLYVYSKEDKKKARQIIDDSDEITKTPTIMIAEGTMTIDKKEATEIIDGLVSAARNRAKGTGTSVEKKFKELLNAELEELDTQSAAILRTAAKKAQLSEEQELAEAEGKYGYIAFYNGKRIEVYANTSYEAQQKAAAQLKVPPKKQYMISVHLAEKDGKAVVHTAVD